MSRLFIINERIFLIKSERTLLANKIQLALQVFRVAKSISHHARFRSTMVSGGGRLRPQEDSLASPIDMIVGTPGRVLQHIEEGNMVYGDIRYLVIVFVSSSRCFVFQVSNCDNIWIGLG